MADEELSKIDLVSFTKLPVGTRVSHVNAGKWGGNRMIPHQLGTVVSHTNQGLSLGGSLVVTVKVLWDDGSQYEMGHSLAKKV